MKIQSQSVKDDLHKRLRRVEGQARGVVRMLDDDRDCREIMQQLKAIESAVKNASHVFMRAYAKDCMLAADTVLDREMLIDEVMDLMSKAG